MLIKNLRYCREKLNLKQKDVARNMNVDYSTYCGWETDKDIMSLKRLIQFANLYKYSLDFLLGFSKVNNYTKDIIVNYQTVGNNLLKLKKNIIRRKLSLLVN